MHVVSDVVMHGLISYGQQKGVGNLGYKRVYTGIETVYRCDSSVEKSAVVYHCYMIMGQGGAGSPLIPKTSCMVGNRPEL